MKIKSFFDLFWLLRSVLQQAAALNLEDSIKRLRTDVDHMSTATWQICRRQHHPAYKKHQKNSDTETQLK
jgi:hypothetical protein